jgi:hypothetical protein
MRHVFIAISVLTAALPAASGELDERRRIIATARTLFEKEEFEELTRLAREYRSKASRTSSGIWKLTVFYDGVDGTSRTPASQKRTWEEIDGRARRWTERFPDEPAGYISRAGISVNRGWAHRGAAFAR